MKPFIVISLLNLLLLAGSSFARTTTATSTGDWNSGGRWNNGVPLTVDTVIIPFGIQISLPQNYIVAYNYLYIEVSGELFVEKKA